MKHKRSTFKTNIFYRGINLLMKG